jgi:solute carrier family 12 (sodium/potassium/chloride transporter), member 2
VGDFPGELEAGFPGISFWAVFAVFFPATVGLESGVSMSGELKHPRRALSVGTMAAFGVSFLVYLSVALFLGFAAPAEELTRNYLVLVETAWAPAILAGLLGATFSSALASIVGAPRILHALAEDGITPKSEWLGARDRRGEPKHALLVTLGIVLIALLMREINAIAPLITLFFLATYASASAVALLESSLHLPSYRPSWRINRLVPLVGLVGSVAGMFLVHVLFTVIAWTVIGGVLAWLYHRRLKSPFSDIRGAVYAAIARWAGDKAKQRRTQAERTWIPEWLVPVEDADSFSAVAPLVIDIASPEGTVRAVAIVGHPDSLELEQRVTQIAEEISENHVEVETLFIEEDRAAGPPAAFAVLRRDEVDTPDLVLLHAPHDEGGERAVRKALGLAADNGMGAALVIGAEEDDRDQGSIALWLEPPRTTHPDEASLGDADLALLLAFRLSRNRGVDLQLISAVPDESHVQRAEDYLGHIAERARLPGPPQHHIIEDRFPDAVADAPEANIHVFPMSSHVDFDRVRRIHDLAGTTCLFVRDSGAENAFA